MGVNCYVRLATDVQAKDAALAIGVLAGLPAVYKNQSDGRYWTTVDGANDKATESSGYSNIILQATSGNSLVDGEKSHFAAFFYCNRSNNKISNMLYPTSTPFWCAVGKRLVQFFGGEIVFSDCEAEKGLNVYRSKRHCPVDEHGLIPHDGEPWRDYHKAVAKLKPVTKSEMNAVGDRSGYPDYRKRTVAAVV